MHGLVGESEELHLGDGNHAGDGQADGRSCDGPFGKWHVDDPVLAELFEESLGDPEDTAGAGDVLAQDDDPVVAPHLGVEAFVDRLEHVQFGHAIGPSAPTSAPASRAAR